MTIPKIEFNRYVSNNGFKYMSIIHTEQTFIHSLFIERYDHINYGIQYCQRLSIKLMYRYYCSWNDKMIKNTIITVLASYTLEYLPINWKFMHLTIDIFLVVSQFYYNRIGNHIKRQIMRQCNDHYIVIL